MARLKTFRNINNRGEIGHNRYRTGPNINGYIKVSSKTCLTDFEGLHFLWNFEWCQFVSVSGFVGHPVRQVIVLSAFVRHNRIRSASLSRVRSCGTIMVELLPDWISFHLKGKEMFDPHEFFISYLPFYVTKPITEPPILIDIPRLEWNVPRHHIRNSMGTKLSFHKYANMNRRDVVSKFTDWRNILFALASNQVR